MKHTYYFDEYAMGYMDIGGTGINPGDAVLVYTRENVMTGREEWAFRKDFAESGYPGNMDGSVRRFHGWRGTTNNIAVYAHGVFTVKSVDHISKRRNGWTERYLKVVLNKTDIKREDD